MEYQIDGEIHALSNDWAYLIKKIKEFNINIDHTEIQEAQREFYKKYAEYIYNFNKEKAIEMILEKLTTCNLLGYTPDDHQFIYRPPEVMDCLAQFGTIALKFRRAQKDNLGEKDV